MGEHIILDKMDIKFQSFGKFLNSYTELSTKSWIVELLDTEMDPTNSLQDPLYRFAKDIVLTIFRSSIHVQNEEWVPYFQKYPIGQVNPLVSAAAQLDKKSDSYTHIKRLLEKKRQTYNLLLAKLFPCNYSNVLRPSIKYLELDF